MAKLTAAQRNRLPASAFAGPGRSYPVNDAAHAANAKARVTQQVKSGNLSAAQASRIDAKANRVLNSKGTKAMAKAGIPTKNAVAQLGGLKGGEVMKNTAAPSGSTPRGSSSFASGSKIKHHVPLHTDHKRSTKNGMC